MTALLTVISALLDAVITLLLADNRVNAGVITVLRTIQVALEDGGAEMVEDLQAATERVRKLVELGEEPTRADWDWLQSQNEQSLARIRAAMLSRRSKDAVR